MCLTCDANWSDFITLNEDTSEYSMTLADDTCTNLQADCYGYLVAMEEMGHI